MRISVLGLGRLGQALCGCLAHLGHHVLGMDVDGAKVSDLARGRTSLVEAGLGKLLTEQAAAWRIAATAQLAEAVEKTDLSYVCVGTPSLPDGGMDLSQVREACQSIGAALRTKAALHTVVLCSTCLPDSLTELRSLIEQASGKREGEGLGFAVQPEFLREGSAVEDYLHPSRIVIGTDHAAPAELLLALYRDLPGTRHIVSPATAMMAKYADNAFHAMKVAFANEVGRLSRALGIDGQAVMSILCADQRLNLSGAYLKPGAAFGGGCLPKDLRALNCRAAQVHAELPLLASLLESNRSHLRHIASLIRSCSPGPVGIFGAAFKAGTGDLRESPALALAAMLGEEGRTVLLCPDNNPAAALPAGPWRQSDAAAMLAECPVLVAGHGGVDWPWIKARLRADQRIIDLHGAGRAIMATDGRYLGSCW